VSGVLCYSSEEGAVKSPWRSWTPGWLKVRVDEQVDGLLKGLQQTKPIRRKKPAKNFTPKEPKDG